MLNRQTQKTTSVILLLAIFMTTLFGCAEGTKQIIFTPTGVQAPAEEKSSSEPRSIEGICADIVQSKYLGDNIIIDDIEILKRQTRPEESSDVVYATVTAHDDQRKLIRTLILLYTLYNEGWIMDEICDDMEADYWAEPLVGPDYSLVDQYFNDYNSSRVDDNAWGRNPPYSSWIVENETLDLSNGVAYLEVRAKREHPLWDTDEIITLAYYANAYSGLWDGMPPEEVDHQNRLDLSKACNKTYSGSYQFLSLSYWAELTILRVDYDNKTITINCTYELSNEWVKDYSGTYYFTQANDDWDGFLIIQLDSNVELHISSKSIFIDDVQLYNADNY